MTQLMGAGRRRTALAAAADRNATLFDSLARSWDVGGDVFEPIASRLVELTAPEPGDRVADIGCGTGTALLDAAEAVGPTGRAVGIDISRAMITIAAERARSRGLSHVTTLVDDAQWPMLPQGSFDSVVSSLVLHHLVDPAAALVAWRRLLVRGGRLGLATLGPVDETWRSIDAVFARSAPGPPPAGGLGSGSGSTPFAGPGDPAPLLSDAGFVAVRSHSVDLAVHFEDADHWVAFTLATGQRATWSAVPTSDRARVRDEAIRRLEAAAVPGGGYTLVQQIRYTLGERPGLD